MMRSVKVGIVRAPLSAVDAAMTAGPQSATSREVGLPVTDAQRVGERAIVVPIPPSSGIRAGSLRFDLRAVPEGTEITVTSELELGMPMRLVMWVMRRIAPEMADPASSTLDNLIPELEAEAAEAEPPPPS